MIFCGRVGPAIACPPGPRPLDLLPRGSPVGNPRPPRPIGPSCFRPGFTARARRADSSAWWPVRPPAVRGLEGEAPGISPQRNPRPPGQFSMECKKTARSVARYGPISTRRRVTVVGFGGMAPRIILGGGMSGTPPPRLPTVGSERIGADRGRLIAAGVTPPGRIPPLTAPAPARCPFPAPAPARGPARPGAPGGIPAPRLCRAVGAPGSPFSAPGGLQSP